jgi:hypothetical protein
MLSVANIIWHQWQMNEYRAMVEWYLRGKTSPITTLSTPNSTWTDVVSKPGLHSERPVTNHLSYVQVPLKLATQPPHTTAQPTVCCWIPPKLSVQNHGTTALVKHFNKKHTFLCAVQLAMCAQLYTPHLNVSLAPLAIAQWHPLQNAVVSVSADQLSCLQMWSFSSKRDDSNKTKLYPRRQFRAYESGNASVQNLTVFPYFT